MNVVCAALLLASSMAFDVESESLFRTYELRAVSEETLLFAPFSQSLRLGVTQPIRRGHVSFNTYFRGIGDAAYQDSSFAPRIYLAHIDYEQGRRHPVALRVGRQIHATSTRFFTFDGVRFRYRSPTYFAIDTYAGTLVNEASFEDPSKFDRIGAGLSVSLEGITGTQAQLGLHHVQSENGPVRDDVSLDFGHRLNNRFRVYGNGMFNGMLFTLDEALLGTTVRLSPRGMAADVEAFRYRPSFDADSIFNLFQTEGFHEGRVRYRVPIAVARTMAWARAGVQLYSDQPGLDATSIVFGLGGRTTLTRRLFLSYAGQYATGYGGQRVGGRLVAGAKLLDDRLVVSGGAHVVDATSEVLTLNEGTFLSVFASARMQLQSYLELAVMTEEQLSDVGGNRVRATANLFLRWDSFAPREKIRQTQRRRRRRPKLGAPEKRK